MIAERYERLEEIGRGGMASVWRGHDTVLERDVALKRVLAVDEVGVERAVREAQLAARLNHPQVVAVYDLVAEDDQHWLVMEHVDGTSLADRVADFGGLDRTEVMTIGAQLAEALAIAHEHDIVHRDVKPSNVLLPIDGPAKLSDFGIARAENDEALTRTGLVTGSPAYLSPEVASGQRAVAASDVWSLGATLLHAATGQRPYDGADHLMGTLYRIVNDDPPRLDGGDALASVVADTMTKDVETRPTAEEVAERLRAAIAPTEVAEPTRAIPLPDDPRHRPSRPSVPRDRLVLVGVAAAVALLGGLGYLLVQGNGDSDTASTTPSAVADAAPTAAQLEQFARTYVATAAADPGEGFALLTPAYQQESGGLPGYRSFWERVADPRIDELTVDAADSTVTYRYTYSLDDQPRDETVRLRVENVGGALRIASASAS